MVSQHMGHSHVPVVVQQMEINWLSILHQLLRESGLCIDSVVLLEWILKRHYRKVVAFRFLRLRFSPAILANALQQGRKLEDAARLYSLGMSFLNMGSTYKTTSINRTLLADKEILRIARDLDKPSLLDIGASDGVSALACLNQKKLFSRVTLSDKYNCFFEKNLPCGKIFLDAEKRLLGVKLLCFYIKLQSAHAFGGFGYSIIETANPLLLQHAVTRIQHFDMFQDVQEHKYDIVKCSNILNLSYFPTDTILQAIENISRSVKDHGHLVISHNNAKYNGNEAVLVLKKEGPKLIMHQSINSPELAHCFMPSESVN